MIYAYRGREIFPSVEVYHDAAVCLGGVSMRDYFLDPETCARAQRQAEEQLRIRFGDLPVRRAISGPPISYGHLVCLGSPVEYPNDGEPNVHPLFTSLEQGIAHLQAQQNIDFASQPIFRHYVALNTHLRRQFPDRSIALTSGLGAQGPLTSAMLLRGPDFILDILDVPDRAKRYLELLTDSIVAFRRFCNRFNDQPEINPDGAGLCDDLASLLAPDQWPEFVLPSWNRFYAGLTTGTSRNLHCENLAPAHLPHLHGAGVTHYQPSVSDQLTLENVKAATDIPFDWLLYAYHVTNMSDDQIQAWVDATVAAGVTRIRTQFGAYAIQAGKLDRIHAFYRAFEKYRAL